MFAKDVLFCLDPSLWMFDIKIKSNQQRGTKQILAIKPSIKDLKKHCAGLKMNFHVVKKTLRQILIQK